MTLKQLYDDAILNHYAVGAFNFCNLESMKAILNAAEELGTPVILGVSEGALKYVGEDFLKAVIVGARKTYSVPFFVHLDHGKSLEVCKKAISCGFDSVMIDGSAFPFDENVSLTKSVVDYAHPLGIQVEAELGRLKGIEDDVSSNEHLFTSPDEAKLFVEKTGCDSLAIAIGTSHGVNKFAGEARIRVDILSEIESKLGNFPLVLHGASSIPSNIVDEIKSLGGDLKNAKGVPESVLYEVSTKHNICKINVDSDLRMATTLAVRRTLKDNPSEIDPRKYLGNAMKEMQTLVGNKIKYVFSTKQARK